MLRLLSSLGYTPPNLELYKTDTCEVIWDEEPKAYVLSVNGEEWMSYRTQDHDQAYELYSHWDQAEGHCICTGLGLGVRENWILNKPGVTKVTVVEKNQEIIDYHKFINPRLFDDVEVIHCDANEYKGKCDTLLLDHYEEQASKPISLFVDANSIVRNIECQKLWMWTLETIVGGMSYQRSQKISQYVSKLLIYNEIKNRFDLPFPDLTESDLDLYYFMYNSKTVSIFKAYHENGIQYSWSR